MGNRSCGGGTHKQAAPAARAESELDQPHLHTRDSPPGISESCVTWPVWGFIFVVWLFSYILFYFPPPREGADASRFVHTKLQGLRDVPTLLPFAHGRG